MKIVFCFLFAVFFIENSFAKTWYVSTAGSNDNDGTTKERPFKTIAYASQKMNGSDTLYIRVGTYSEAMMHNFYGFKFKNGKSGAMTRFLAYPGEEALARGYSKSDTGKVIIKPPARPVGQPNAGLFYGVDTQYIEVRGLVIDGTNTGSTVKFDHNYRDNVAAKNNLLINNEIRYGGGVGGGGGNSIIGNWIHHSVVYGLYVAFDNGLFERNLVEDCYGYGLHLYQQDHAVNGWVVRNNIFRRNGASYRPVTEGRDGSLKPLPAVILTRGSNQFYNNLVYDNVYGGVTVGLNAKNTLVANNTIYGNGVHGIRVNSSLGGADGTRIINNIVWNNSGTPIINFGANTISQNNLTTDPKFINATTRDFRLQATSPAINSGKTITEVKTDFVYKARPSGGYDIGAYEYGATKAILAAPSNLRVGN